MTMVSMFGIFLIVVGLAYHFAALQLFNLLIPKDANARVVASGLSYGPNSRHRYDLYGPRDATQNLPLLVFVYGGSWDTGDRGPYEFAGKAYAAQGYLVAVIDYRLVPEVLYPGFVEDVALAVAHLKTAVAQYGGDASRIYLTGHSAGAYNLMQAVLHPDYAEQMNGIKAVATLSGPFDFLPLDSPKSIAAFQHFKPLEETQPVTHARAGAPPMLIMHGSDDGTVLPKNGINLSTRMKAAGGVAELKIYPNTGHVGIMLSLAKPLRHRTSAFQDTLDFFKRYP